MSWVRAAVRSCVAPGSVSDAQIRRPAGPARTRTFTRTTVTGLADRTPPQEADPARDPDPPEHPDYPRILAVFNDATGPLGPETSTRPSTSNSCR